MMLIHIKARQHCTAQLAQCIHCSYWPKIALQHSSVAQHSSVRFLQLHNPRISLSTSWNHSFIITPFFVVEYSGEEQCPRDDLFSLIFVFCDLVCGKLPWSEAAKIKDKGKVATLKKQYLADPRRFVEWVKHQAEDADRIKVSHTG